MPANAEQTSLTGTWYDRDKNVGQNYWYFEDDNGNDKWDQGEAYSLYFTSGWKVADPWHEGWFDDINYNGGHDPGELAAKYPGSVWTNGTQALDRSCWMASASNILRYVGGPDRYEAWAYETGVPTSLTFDDGGQPAWPLTADGYRATEGIAKYPPITPWLVDPIDWTEHRLQQGLPVGIQVTVPFLVPTHALTVYAIDTSTHTLTVADSDQDSDGADYKTYNYTYAFGVTGWTWTLDDYLESPVEITYAASLTPCSWQGSGTGAGTSDWHASTNWSVSEVPHNKDIVEIGFDAGADIDISGNAEAFRLRLYGNSATVRTEMGSSLTVGASEYIGVDGVSALVQNGGTHTVGQDLVLGQDSGSEGIYALRSGSMLEVEDNEYVGYSGTGTFTQSSGTHTVSNNLVMANEAGSEGSYELSGGTLDVGRYLVVGRLGSATFRQTGGTNVVGSASPSPSSGLTIGGGDREAGYGYGQYDMEDGMLEASQILIGYKGTGTFNQTGGDVTVVDRLFLGPGNAYSTADGQKGTYQLTDGTLTVSGQERVGDSSVGHFIQHGGSNATPTMYIGYGNFPGCTADPHGRYDLFGGSLEVSDKLYVGYYDAGVAGEGLLNVSGGQMTIGSLEVGTHTGEGQFVISNAASNIEILDSLAFGPDGSFTAVPGSTVHMIGSDFENHSTDAGDLADMINLNFIFEGGTANIDPFEVAGEDMGAIMAGFADNFALGTLTLGGVDVGNVKLVDTFDNQLASFGSEALYVENLILGPGSYLDLNGLNLYYLGFTDLGGSFFNGTPTQVPEPLTIVLLGFGGLGLLRWRCYKR